MSNSGAVKATLYTFDGSVWGSVPRIGLIEKGYATSDVEVRQVDLFSAANFSPSYLRLNSKGTVPTLVVPLANTTSSEVDTKYKAICDTKGILEFLDQSRSQQLLDLKSQALENSTTPTKESESSTSTSHDGGEAPAPVLAPATIEGKGVCDQLISLVHSSGADPNFLMMGSRSESELLSNAKGLQGTFCSNRQAALLKYQQEITSSSEEALKNGSSNPRSISTSQNLLGWYSSKITELQPLTNAYSSASQGQVSEFGQGLVLKTKAHWKSVFETLVKLNSLITGPFALGDQVSLADVHLMAWFARLLAVCEGLKENQESGKKEFEALENSLLNECLGNELGNVKTVVQGLRDGKLRSYWDELKGRESFKAVYGKGLH